MKGHYSRCHPGACVNACTVGRLMTQEEYTGRAVADQPPPTPERRTGIFTWRWYTARHPSRGSKAHLFENGARDSVCGYAWAARAGDVIQPADVVVARCCQSCRSWSVKEAIRREADREAYRHPNNCPVQERTADGRPVGRCWFHLPDGKTCPRHGDVSDRAAAQAREDARV